MKLKANVATWLRPFLPTSEWVDRTLWDQRLDDVCNAFSDGRLDTVEGLLQGLEHGLAGSGCDPETRVDRLTRLGELFQDLAGDFDAAERLFRQAVERGEAASVEYATLALPMNDLGLLLTNQRRYHEAESIVERLTALTRDHFGEEDTEYASCLENLAAIYRQTGRSAEASDVRARAVRIRRAERARAWSSQ
jgi:tetratricopeptide (TPR) repeat protein